MTQRSAALLAALLLGGCSNIPTTSEGVAFLEVAPSVTVTIPVGGTVQFFARTLDKSGNPIDVAVHWRTPDTTISIGETSGLVTGVSVGDGRVQAVVGNDELVSDFVVVKVTEPTATARRP